MTQEDFSAVCPYLGLADDADSHATYATEAHRCYRLPNPTRIAPPHQETFCLGANHVTCPVYLGEGVPAAPVASGSPFAPSAAAEAPEQAATVQGPQAGQRPAGRKPFENTPGGAAARPPRKQSAGSLGPRPRAGGVSMPVATIGLFALAAVVIAIAFAINNVVGGGDDDSKLSPSDLTGTQVAVKTQTARAGGGQPTSPPTTANQTPGAGQTPAIGQTPGQARTPGTGTPTSGTTTPGAGSASYTVKAGDLCGTIASDNGITLQQLLTANQMVEDDCTRLQVGQVLKLR